MHEPQPFPSLLYVKQVHGGQPQYFSVSTDHASLVGLEPVDVATYRYVETKRWKRLLTLEQQDRAKSRAARRARAKPAEK